jgi:hypothetical protein
MGAAVSEPRVVWGLQGWLQILETSGRLIGKQASALAHPPLACSMRQELPNLCSEQQDAPCTLQETCMAHLASTCNMQSAQASRYVATDMAVRPAACNTQPGRSQELREEPESWSGRRMKEPPIDYYSPFEPRSASTVGPLAEFSSRCVCATVTERACKFGALTTLPLFFLKSASRSAARCRALVGA